ncbi:putative spermidine/putrescine transport system substrate-binding protein [Acidovorax sp. 69]|uniref:ABC transporter substrate-binding protein n=1 Tax=Acidovorax sp. 69 TaxID=2035202 RepID=UPI000CB0A5FF|nr:putative spermidine/putrescine transport system substrate-binding protein [Acidovorax sp. 69]
MVFMAWRQAVGTFTRQMPRRVVAALLVVASGMVLLAGPVQAGTVLRVLSWPGYADPDFVAVFEKRFGVKVEITTVASDDVLRAKLASPEGPGFDLVAANTAEIARLVAQNMLTPLPISNISNTARQLPRFRQLHAIAGITSRGDVYAMPFTYSEMGLIYDRKQFSSPPDSIAVLWDPRWQGRVLAFDGSSHGFSLAAMYRGLAPFRIDAGRFRPLAKDLVALRRNVRSFYSLPEESVELFRKHKVAVMHANYGQQQLKQLRDAGLDVGYVVPKEGALAWLDCWAITRRSTQVALAAEWINYMLEPTVSREFTRRQGLANTLDEPPALSGDVPMGPIVWLEPVEDEALRAQLWQRILSGDRPARF